MVIRILIGMFVVFILENCATLDKKETDFYDIEIEQFSSSIQLLLSNQDFLKKEVLKVNAKRPSIQRIISGADTLWLKGDIKMANLELERGLRISKDESAIYLRLSHLRLEQGLIKESRAFASRGLLNDGISAWEILLLSIYSDGN